MGEKCDAAGCKSESEVTLAEFGNRGLCGKCWDTLCSIEDKGEEVVRLKIAFGLDPPADLLSTRPDLVALSSSLKKQREKALCRYRKKPSASG